MIHKIVKSIAIFLVLVSVGACDPEALVKSKTPTPIQNLLTFGPSPKDKMEIPLETAVRIKSPKSNEIFQIGTDVHFLAELTSPDPELPQPELTWMLMKNKSKLGDAIGKGLSAKRKLDKGQYSVELVATRGEKRFVQKINFKVGLLRPGVVKGPDQAGLPGTAIALLNQSGEKLSEAQTKADGTFMIEYPTDDEYKVVPAKHGYSFSPLFLQQKYSAEPMAFSGYKGELSDVLLTETPESNLNVIHMCPGKDYFLKLKIDIDDKPKRLNALLVTQDKDSERVSPFVVLDKLDGEQKLDASNRVILKVQAPTATALGVISDTYTLRVKLFDQQNRSFDAEAADQISIDPRLCFQTQSAEGVKLQEEGAVDGALKAFASVEQLYRVIQDPAVKELTAKAYFNSGLLYLQKAFADKEERPETWIKDALHNFTEALKLNKKDAESVFFIGLCYSILDGPSSDKVLKTYDQALDMNPDIYPAYEFRAQIYLASAKKESVKDSRKQEYLLEVVTDLTKYLSRYPNEQEVRKLRKQTLVRYLELTEGQDETKPKEPSAESKDQQGGKSEEAKLRTAKEALNLAKFIRK
jgi:tetratricopeptide (TPR) repeat protein